MLQLFNDHEQPQQDPSQSQPLESIKMRNVLIVKELVGVLLWFVISMNVSLFSRDSDNKNWAYLALFLTKGVNISLAIALGGKEGISQGISTSVATIAGTIAGGL